MDVDITYTKRGLQNHRIGIPWQECCILKVTNGPTKLLENFRCGQLEAILPVLHGKDAFVRMATGTGKSLRGFSVPLTLSDGSVAVIVGPFNERMHKHVSDRFADLK